MKSTAAVDLIPTSIGCRGSAGIELQRHLATGAETTRILRNFRDSLSFFRDF